MSKPKISVIIPVYNVEEYLEETLMSIANQSLIEDIEVLMIDDGSSDNSKYIIDRFAFDYDNFYAYHKKNEGQGIARNYGMELAKGKYIHFLDSDDYIVPDTYEKLYDIAKSKDYDFVVCNSMRFNRYDCIEDYLFKQSFGNLDGSGEFSNINENPYSVWDTAIWNKLYKKEFLTKNDIQFPNKKIFFEDLLFSFKAYASADKFYFLDEFLYFWRFRENMSSTTQHRTIKYFQDRLEILLNIQDAVNDADLSDETMGALYYKWLHHDIMISLRNFNNIPQENLDELLSMVKRILNFIPDNVRQEVDSYRKIVYSMVEDNDLNGLSYFIPLEYELKTNPSFELKLEDKYLKLIDFKKDALKENLMVKKTAICKRDNDIVIKFENNINYLSKKCPHEIKAILIDENDDEFPLDVRDNEIYIPVDLIVSKKYFKIKMRYFSDSIMKESYLTHHERGSILLYDCDLEINVEPNAFFSIHVRKTDDNDIVVDDLRFVDDEFIFEGIAKNKIENIAVENITTFEKFEYPISFVEDNENGYRFMFKIPYSDVIKSPIKKWEIKSTSKFKTIQITKKYEFFREYDKILFLNDRNKIIMSDDLYDKYYKLEDMSRYLREILDKNNKLKKNIKKIKKKNKKLNDENEQLKKKIDEYKSRKILKIVDKFK